MSNPPKQRRSLAKRRRSAGTAPSSPPWARLRRSRTPSGERSSPRSGSRVATASPTASPPLSLVAVEPGRDERRGGQVLDPAEHRGDGAVLGLDPPPLRLPVLRPVLVLLAPSGFEAVDQDGGLAAG